MSSPLSAKRRRLNDATNTLAKPFVSPMRSAKKEGTSLYSKVAKQLYHPSTLAHTIQTTEPASSTAIPTNFLDDSVSKPSTNAAKRTPARRQHASTPLSNRNDPAELAAQRALTALELQIKALRNDIDTLRQANPTTSSSKGSELEGLTEKWRLASQQAAEEVFGAVKERVCRMGGVVAWRETEKQKHERTYGLGDFAPEPEVNDDADCEFDSQGEELPEDEQEFRKKEKRRARQEAIDAADVEETPVVENDGKPKVWQEPGNDDDTFTMDMMLRSLNIDLNVIGYDKALQRWIT